MSNRVRFTREDVAKNTFYQMPKFLFQGEFKNLNNDARVLYSLLKDRHELSLKNEWTNENNEVYIVFSRIEMCETLGVTENTILKTMNTLKEYGLIEEERIGFGKANKIFLLTVEMSVNTQKCQNRKFCGSVTSNNETPEPQNLRFIPYNKTDVSDTESKSTSDGMPVENYQIIDNDGDNYDQEKNISETETELFSIPEGKTNEAETAYNYQSVKQTIHGNICYNHYRQHCKSDIGLIDELVDCMLDVILTEGNTVKINGENKSRQMVINQYLKINPSDIELILGKYKEQSHKITHIHNYLKTVLYNVKQEQGHYYTNAVKSNGWT